MTVEIIPHEDDSMSIEVVVADKTTGLAKNISGATLGATLTNIHGTILIADTVVVSDGPAGKLLANFLKERLTTGVKQFQARVGLGAESQIVVDHEVTVLPAHI